VALAESGDPKKPQVALARAQVMRYRDRQMLDETRLAVQAAWVDWFGTHDLMLAPMMPVAAFPHAQGPMGSRTVEVDGTALPYFNQLFWAGLATLPGLPSTIVPAGLSASGLPVGVQLIAAPFADFRAIGIARRLEEMGFGFRAPAMPWAEPS
jgi:amidase